MFSLPTTAASTAELEIAGSDLDATGDAGLADSSFGLDCEELWVLETDPEWCFEGQDKNTSCLSLLLFIASFDFGKFLLLNSWYDGTFAVAI